VTNTRGVIAAVALFGVVGCQTMPYQPYARDVKKRPQAGGVVALKSDHRDEDKAKAAEIMKSNCGGAGYKVLEEGEVVVGTTTNSTATENTDYGNKHQVGTFLGLPVTSGSDRTASTNTVASTTQVKEWQISYECVAAAATPDEKPIAKAKKSAKN
jgi:hypothetical protein